MRAIASLHNGGWRDKQEVVVDDGLRDVVLSRRRRQQTS